MKKILIILFCILLYNTSYAASQTSIMRHAFNTPERISTDIKKLTKYLTKPLNSEYDKLQAIAYWISSHIAYDAYKYDGKIHQKSLKYKYDILKAKAGICSDFAKLFNDMSMLAGIKNVRIVTGHVVENVKSPQKNFSSKQLGVGHAWNEAIVNGRRFYIDTTWMAPMTIGKNGKKRKSAYKHRIDIKKRGRQNTQINTNINTFYFDFTPKEEVQQYRRQHYETD